MFARFHIQSLPKKVLPKKGNSYIQAVQQKWLSFDRTIELIFIWTEKWNYLKNPNQGGGGKRRGLGPRNDVLTTCKAVTPRGGQRIIAAFFPL